MAKPYRFSGVAPVIHDPAAADIASADKAISKGFRDVDSSFKGRRRSLRTKSGGGSIKSLKPTATLKAQKDAKAMNFFTGRG